MTSEMWEMGVKKMKSIWRRIRRRELTCMGLATLILVVVIIWPFFSPTWEARIAFSAAGLIMALVLVSLGVMSARRKEIIRSPRPAQYSAQFRSRTKTSDLVKRQLVLPDEADRGQFEVNAAYECFIEKQRLTSEIWDKVRVMEYQDWQINLVDAVVKLHIALAAAASARYAFRYNRIPSEDNFPELIRDAFQPTYMGEVYWFNKLRNKISHIGYEPSEQEVRRAFAFIKPLMEDALNYSPPQDWKME